MKARSLYYKFEYKYKGRTEVGFLSKNLLIAKEAKNALRVPYHSDMYFNLIRNSLEGFNPLLVEDFYNEAD